MRYKYCLKLISNVDVRDILLGFGLVLFVPCSRTLTKYTAVWDSCTFTTSQDVHGGKCIHSINTLYFTDPDEFIAAVKKYILKQIPVKKREQK